MIVWYLAMMRRSYMSSSLDSSCESTSSDVVNLKPKVTQTQVSYSQEKSPQIVIYWDLVINNQLIKIEIKRNIILKSYSIINNPVN